MINTHTELNFINSKQNSKLSFTRHNINGDVLHFLLCFPLSVLSNLTRTIYAVRRNNIICLAAQFTFPSFIRMATEHEKEWYILKRIQSLNYTNAPKIESTNQPSDEGTKTRIHN